MSTPWTTLVDAETLAAELHRDDLVVIDCRHSLMAPEAGATAHATSHIPGARHAQMDRDLSAPKAGAPGDAGRHPWPDAQRFSATLGAWGIGASTQVVAYDDGDGAFAARLWFLLHAVGHEAVAVLDGGWARWIALGLPVNSATPEVSRRMFVGSFDDTLLCDATQVQAHLDAGGLLIDARAAERFRGDVEPIDSVAGHVPGALNRPYVANLAEGRFKSAEVLADEFAVLLDARAAADVVAMCGSGVTACHHLLAMQHAGLPGARLFTGSWSGWIGDGTRSVATGDA